ncbi:MAG: 16S rRNA (cytosine(1402)-N(4))-methyltransferase RsmH [Leptolyngbya sp. PLA1]|nr:16S rRNA (cytosine(1402)-N(4))-methyltransferase RsmH [Leptolyngbya sp. PLA1]
MPAEVLAALRPAPEQTYVDATAGLGGHASLVAPRIVPRGTILLNDADPSNLARAGPAVRAAAPEVRVLTRQGNFAELPHVLRGMGIRADMLLADLGFASSQVDDPSRGFSFSRDGPLDMRLDPTLPMSAADLVASIPESELARLIEEFGEDRHARRIARKVVQARARSPIVTTAALAEVVRSACPPGAGGIDPATRTFQAIRIAVNDELGSLEALLGHIEREAEQLASGTGRWLAPGARVAFLTFHSLEDRPVKRSFQRLQALGCTLHDPAFVAATPEEVARNARSRSAKLRSVTFPMK